MYCESSETVDKRYLFENDSEEESTDSEADSELERHVPTSEHDGEDKIDVELMKQMGLPLSFFKV